MSPIDYLIFAVYMGGVLGVGCYFYRRNQSTDDYYVGGRSIAPLHVGLSVVATDVGGGFSIGLGGLGFTMGLSGSWLLFTGLVGAWGTAVLVIPKIKQVDREHGMLTYPDFLRFRYDEKVALMAAVISGIGYLGFTAAQILAGAKLASGTLLSELRLDIPPLQLALWVIGVITVVYTVLGGLKAVIYTDTVQWLILLVGLILVTIPVTLWGELGGIETLRRELPPEFFSLTNVDAVTIVNWMVTIVPIWLVGMTLYQRIYACRTVADAQRAWYIAGLLEYPVMAFMGVLLGMCARVMFPHVEPEMGLPMLIKTALPVGITGIVIASYFSAIMSTADSCLMASSGNFVNDVIRRYWLKNLSLRRQMRVSQLVTLAIGVSATVLASQFERVLEAILLAYGFLVSGLFVPTLGAYFWPRGTARAALWSMLGGGSLTLALLLKLIELPASLASLGFDPACYGMSLSAVLYLSISLLSPSRSSGGAHGAAGP